MASSIRNLKQLNGGGDYPPVLFRLEWLTLSPFAEISGEDGAGVTLSNSGCAFLKPGNSGIYGGVSRPDVRTPVIRVLAGGQIDAPRAGIPKQGGESHVLQPFALQTRRPGPGRPSL